MIPLNDDRFFVNNLFDERELTWLHAHCNLVISNCSKLKSKLIGNSFYIHVAHSMSLTIMFNVLSYLCMTRVVESQKCHGIGTEQHVERYRKFTTALVHFMSIIRADANIYSLELLRYPQFFITEEFYLRWCRLTHNNINLQT